MPPQTLNEEAAQLLSVVLGLIAAGILPAATLLVNTVSAEGRSVKALSSLGEETRGLVRNLFMLLAWVALAVCALLILFIPPPWEAWGSFVGDDVSRQLGQAMALGLLGGVLDRTRTIPSAVFRCLDLRLGIAVDEARQKLRESAPAPGEAAVHFQTKPGFGAMRPVEKV